ncbi:hypothetical protein N7481_009042 [Penicillium waksmanii]|uniref:uncharacterized protein n=1 Tax=Penicillium waksmanii TaxID=69791 RepID=UPI002548718D|nr:uncharacterized protein N7481_009042 [Penicillium waksmanii]KAJ5975335.1 hypothetical protein N7481_009042 [Penicillium waksmanii]
MTREASLVSYGEGPRPISRDGDPITVTNSVFIVRPTKSYPNLAPNKELPDNIRYINKYNVSFFHKLAAFFQSQSTSYSIFIRRVIRGYRGSLYLESYIFKYNNKICYKTEEEIISLLSHEIIHSFLLIDLEDNGYDNRWYIEGSSPLAKFYCPITLALRALSTL